MNVTSPELGLIVYVPSPGIVTGPSVGSPVVGSISFGAFVSSIGTSLSPPLNTGVPVCGTPCTSSDVTSSPVGLTGVTVGVYLAFTVVPFVSSRWTSTPVAVPVNCGSGWNLTFPSSIVYVPSPSTTTLSVGFPVVGSISFGAFVSSIGTTFSSPLIVTFPPLNSGNPVCALPWTSVVLAGVAVGLTGLIFGVYVVLTGVPFISAAWIVTGGTGPTYVLSSGVYTATGSLPGSFTRVYLPITLFGSFGSFTTTSSVGFPFSPTNVTEPGLIGTGSDLIGFPTGSSKSAVPPLNVIGCFWVAPCTSVDSAGLAVGLTPTITGVYSAVAGVLFLSTRWTVTGCTGPT